MADKARSTVAAIVLSDAAKPSIDYLIDAITNSKFGRKALVRSVTYDCEDLVYLDFDAVRIALHDVICHDGMPDVICVAVGSIPEKEVDAKIDYDRLAKHLVKSMMKILKTHLVIWHEDDRALRGRVMDDFLCELETMMDFIKIQVEEVAKQEQSLGRSSINRYSESKKKTNQKQTDTQGSFDYTEYYNSENFSELDDQEIYGIKEALRTGNGIDRSLTTPMAATMYTISLAFFFFLPEAGATLLSYTFLRDKIINTLRRTKVISSPTPAFNR